MFQLCLRAVLFNYLNHAPSAPGALFVPQDKLGSGLDCLFTVTEGLSKSSGFGLLLSLKNN